LETLENYLKNNPHESNGEIGKKYGKSREVVRRVRNKLGIPSSTTYKVASSDLEQPQGNESIGIDGNGYVSSDRIVEIDDEGQLRNPEMLLKMHNLDPELFEIVKVNNSKWQSPIKASDDCRLLYASKLAAKPRTTISKTMIADLIATLPIGQLPKPRKLVKPKSDGYMLEINIADLHFGKLGWDKEVGEDYDIKIAEQRMWSMIDDAKRVIDENPIEKILFVFTNDFFHFDNSAQTTTAGTPQDSDSRWQKVFNEGVRLLVDVINELSQHAPVHIPYTASNHDEHFGYTGIRFLEAWFRNDANVTIDSSPSPRKYIRYGNCLIGFSHGSEETKKNLPLLVATEAKKDWSDCDFVELHLAHFHSEQVEEINGLKIRYVPSATGPDCWHNKKGFIGAIKTCQSFLWDKESGLRSIYYLNPLN